jgi:hypothetical protein
MRFQMAQSVSLLLLGIVVLLSSCDKRSPTKPDSSTEYPTIVVPLSPDSLDSAREEFALANPKICSSLNEYGFTDGPLCWEGSAGVAPHRDDETVNALVEMTRDTVLRNSKFTGVTQRSLLEVSHIFGGSLAILVQFKPQYCEGLPILGSEIEARVDSVGVISIRGYHYREIHIPSRRLNAEEARRAVVGMRLKWSYKDGGFHRVEYDDLCRELCEVVFPFESDGKRELRSAWGVPVGCEQLRWTVYIDSVSGDALRVYGPYY